MKLKMLAMILIWGALVIAGCSGSSNDSLDADEFEKRLKATDRPQLVDVRTPSEFQKIRVEGAINLDYNASDFSQKIESLDKSKPVYVYCLSGGRSSKATSFLRKKGFHAFHLEGGLLDWNSRKKPVVGTGVSAGMTSAAFNQKVKNSKLVLVDFYAKWCGPCKIMAPDLEALHQQYAKDLLLVKIDADSNSFVVDSLRVNALPTLHLYKDGIQVWNHSGLLSKKEIEKSILEQM